MSEAVVCNACFHSCRLEEGRTGLCRARKNNGGRIECINYGAITSLALDPIEKKPLKRFMPGSRILSVGSFGCNLYCPFCQNHSISQTGLKESGCDFLSPEELLGIALKTRDSDGNIGVAFTYNEPLIGYEYVRDCAKLLKENGLYTVLVTNGCFNEAVLDNVLPYIDAMNIDLKGFSQSAYDKLGGSLELVKDFIIKSAKDSHIELTSLIVPGINDGLSDMERQCEWIASISPEIPFHITRYFPCYKMSSPPATDIPLIYRLRDIAEKHLEYVFCGNI